MMLLDRLFWVQFTVLALLVLAPASMLAADKPVFKSPPAARSDVPLSCLDPSTAGPLPVPKARQLKVEDQITLRVAPRAVEHWIAVSAASEGFAGALADLRSKRDKIAAALARLDPAPQVFALKTLHQRDGSVGQVALSAVFRLVYAGTGPEALANEIAHAVPHARHRVAVTVFGDPVGYASAQHNRLSGRLAALARDAASARNLVLAERLNIALQGDLKTTVPGAPANVTVLGKASYRFAPLNPDGSVPNTARPVPDRDGFRGAPRGQGKRFTGPSCTVRSLVSGGVIDLSSGGVSGDNNRPKLMAAATELVRREAEAQKLRFQLQETEQDAELLTRRLRAQMSRLVSDLAAGFGHFEGVVLTSSEPKILTAGQDGLRGNAEVVVTLPAEADLLTQPPRLSTESASRFTERWLDLASGPEMLERRRATLEKAAFAEAKRRAEADGMRALKVLRRQAWPSSRGLIRTENAWMVELGVAVTVTLAR